MTNPNYTAVVLVVDRSGSMNNIASTVQEALEEFVNAQVAEPGELTIDTVFFDSEVENRAFLVDPSKTKLDLSIQPRGMTALYDAVGLKIRSFGEVLSKKPEHERPGKVIFVIATDGHENSSKEFTQQAVAELIKSQREKYSWDFTFIGANQDAVLTAQTLNIPENSAITFAASKLGAENVLRSMSGYVASARAGAAPSYSVADRAAAAPAADSLRANPADILVGEVRGTATENVVKAPAKSRARKAPAAKATPKPKATGAKDKIGDK